MVLSERISFEKDISPLLNLPLILVADSIISITILYHIFTILITIFPSLTPIADGHTDDHFMTREPDLNAC